MLGVGIIFVSIYTFATHYSPVRADLTTGLLVHYTFENTSGSNVYDSSGNNRTASLSGNATISSGLSGSGVNFDGTSGYMQVPHQLVPGQQADFTYSFFVKADAGGDSNQYLMGQSSSGTFNNDCFSVDYDNVGKSLKVLATNNGNGAQITTSADLSNWTHIAVTNSHTYGESQVYVNGVATSGPEATCSQALASQFMIGRAPYSGYNMELDGSMDEIRVYNRVLSAAEIYQLATEGNTNSVNITSPSNGSTVKGSVNLTASTSGSPAIASVKYYANGSALSTALTTDPYTYTWDLSAVEQGEYLLVAVATDVNGVTVPSQAVLVTVDNDPTIAMQSSKSIQKTSNRIAWITSEPTTARVDYGLTSSYGSQTTLDTSLSYYHEQTLSNLTPGTTYHYRVTSVDSNDNSVSSSDSTFTTISDATGNEWHVTTSGTSGGNGSVSNPWDLATALAQPVAVQPGDTIWLHGGNYSGNYSSTLTGSATAPIVVRNYNDERVIIDGGGGSGFALTVYGSDAWYWGLEIMSSGLDRDVSNAGSSPPDLNHAYGFYIFGVRTRFINNIVHDTSQGFGFWTPAVDSELYGNLVYYNGWEGPDRGHGHGLYVQNNTGMKYLANNFVFSNFGWGLHAYTEGGRINNIQTDGNTFFENGKISAFGYTTNLLHGGLQIAQNPMIFNNATYYPQAGGGGAIGLGYSAGCNRPTVEGNYFAAESAIDIGGSCTHETFKNNLFYGSVPGGLETNFPDNTYKTSAPTTNATLLRPNQYEPNKTNLTIYNWQQLNSVDVNLSAVLTANDTYEIRDVQNYFGDPIASGTYGGSTVSIPMNSTAVTAAIGSNIPVAPTHTAKEFGAFMIIKTGHTDPADEPPSDGAPSSGDATTNSTNNTSGFGRVLSIINTVTQYATGQYFFADSVVGVSEPNSTDSTEKKVVEAGPFVQENALKQMFASQWRPFLAIGALTLAGGLVAIYLRRKTRVH